MEPTLFIGGPLDGKRREWKSPHLQQRVFTASLEEPIVDIYELKEFASRDGKTRIRVAVHESIQDPAIYLIQNYGK